MRMTCTLGGVLFLGGFFVRNKSFKSLDEQVEILKSRGLRIDNEVEAKTFLNEEQLLSC